MIAVNVEKRRPCFLWVFLCLVFGLTCALLPPQMRLMLIAASVAIAVIAFPEIALGFYPYAGTFKSNPALASVSRVDLTIGLAVLVLLGSVFRLARGREHHKLPKEFLFYFPFVLMMFVSLTYTPDLSAGLDKALRFVVLTGIAILSPFVVLTSEKRFGRFVLTLLLSGVLVGLSSLSFLGTHQRLVAPGGDTIALGYVTGVALAVLWIYIQPRLNAPARFLLYPVSALLMTALIGSGARGATIATMACLALALFTSRRLWIDLAVLCVAFLIVLPYIPIPQASWDYLSTLVNESPVAALSFRSDLMRLGLKLSLQHPISGVGIGGFPFVSPNPRLYDYPHNVFLEIFSEMGVIALLGFVGLWIAAFRRTIHQLLDPEFQQKARSRLVFALLVFGTIDMIKSGDINNIRIMWMFMSLPYIVSGLNDEAMQPQLLQRRFTEQEELSAVFSPFPVSHQRIR